jgi:hypothetical protein
VARCEGGERGLGIVKLNIRSGIQRQKSATWSPWFPDQSGHYTASV